MIPNFNLMMAWGSRYVTAYSTISKDQGLTWSEPVPDRPPHDLVLYGTEGVLVAGTGSVTLYTRTNPDGETRKAPALEAPGRNGPELFVHCILNGEPIEDG